MDKRYDAILVTDRPISAGISTHGRIFADSKERFADGSGVTTSTVIEVSTVTDGVYLAKTLNTTYLCIRAIREGGV